MNIGIFFGFLYFVVAKADILGPSNRSTTFSGSQHENVSENIREETHEEPHDNMNSSYHQNSERHFQDRSLAIGPRTFGITRGQPLLMGPYAANQIPIRQFAGQPKTQAKQQLSQVQFGQISGKSGVLSSSSFGGPPTLKYPTEKLPNPPPSKFGQPKSNYFDFGRCSMGQMAIGYCLDGSCRVPGYECDPTTKKCCRPVGNAIPIIQSRNPNPVINDKVISHQNAVGTATNPIGNRSPNLNDKVISNPVASKSPVGVQTLAANAFGMTSQPKASPTLGFCSWGMPALDNCQIGRTCRNAAHRCDTNTNRCCLRSGSITLPGTSLVCQNLNAQNTNRNSRNSIYPKSQVRRFNVPDNKLLWAIPWQEYNPVEYTAPRVFSNPIADPFLGTPSFTPRFNALDGNINRASYTKIYEVIGGIPRNLVGRTGMISRGLLYRWGPNHAADPIVTRWKHITGSNQIEQHPISRKPILQFVAILRNDTRQWAIPGGMVDPGENVLATLKREFTEEALDSFSGLSQDQRATAEAVLNQLMSDGVCIFAGYVDDPRNTDNAWIETVAVNFHDDRGNLAASLPLKSGSDANAVQWSDLDSRSSYYPAHTQILARVAELRGAHW